MFRLTTPADFASQLPCDHAACGDNSQGHVAEAKACNHGNETDFSDVPDVQKRTRRGSPVAKVAGSRRNGKKLNANDKGKGKGKAVHKRMRVAEEEDDDDNEALPKAKRGRPQGAQNYKPDEVNQLLDIIEVEQPLGSNGWLAVHKRYIKWARANSYIERSLDSIQTKFKQVCLLVSFHFDADHARAVNKNKKANW